MSLKVAVQSLQIQMRPLLSMTLHRHGQLQKPAAPIRVHVTKALGFIMRMLVVLKRSLFC